MLNRLACAVLAGLCLVTGSSANAQGAAGTTLEESVAPGAHYDTAEFRLWFPSGAASFESVLVLVPGSNGDGRPMADDPVWQAFAVREHLALVACRFTDKPHDQAFIEHYVNASQGAGQALLDALAAFARRSGHAELAAAPLLLWGMSAGGEFNYEFVAWKPERVAAFVVNKGGIYYSALTPPAARRVPGILFVGGKDLASRTNTIVGLFAVNRRAGALWALAEEPGAAHIVGRSQDVALVFYADVLALRRRGAAMSESTGFIGDFSAKTFAAASGEVPDRPTAWLPTERVARAWQALVTEKAFDR